MADVNPIGRLALRVEGDWWVAYYAMPDTMKGAIELGRIRMTIVQDPKRKAGFMDLMREVVSDFLIFTTGEEPVWPSPEGTPAPEHERSGRG